MGGVEVGPLSAYRLDFLQSRGNVTAGGEGGCEGAMGLAEVFLVMAMTREELPAQRTVPQTQWMEQVDLFFSWLDDGQIEEFGKWLKNEYAAIEERQVEPTL